MLETFLSVLTNRLNDIEFSLRNALMHKNTVNFHQTGATTRRTKRELLRPFPDFQFRARTQSIASTKRLGENDPSEFIQSEFHAVDYAILYWQWQVGLAIIKSTDLAG
jgi:hypothetical protein